MPNSVANTPPISSIPIAAVGEVRISVASGIERARLCGGTGEELSSIGAIATETSTVISTNSS